VTLTLTVLRATPSLNAFSNPGWTARFRYSDLRKRWRLALTDALLEARSADRVPLPWPRPPHEHVTVHITRYRTPGRAPLDVDNLYGGLKPVLDALKWHELIDDDNPSATTVTAEQDVSPDRAPRTVIRLSLNPPLLREITR
jgi:hypothetical protein